MAALDLDAAVFAEDLRGAVGDAGDFDFGVGDGAGFGVEDD